MVAGEKRYSPLSRYSFVEIFLNKTAKSSHKREDIIRGLKIIKKLANDTIFKRYPYNVDF